MSSSTLTQLHTCPNSLCWFHSRKTGCVISASSCPAHSSPSVDVCVVSAICTLTAASATAVSGLLYLTRQALSQCESMLQFAVFRVSTNPLIFSFSMSLLLCLEMSYDAFHWLLPQFTPIYICSWCNNNLSLEQCGFVLPALLCLSWLSTREASNVTCCVCCVGVWDVECWSPVL